MAFGLHLVGITLISNTTDETTSGSVLQGQFANILEYTVKAGDEVHWPIQTRQILKLYDSTSSELANDDELYWAYKLPAEKTWNPLTEVFRYHKYKKMSIQEQSNINKTPRISMSQGARNAILAGKGSTGIVFAQDREIALKLYTNSTNQTKFGPDQTNNYIELPDVLVE